MAKAPYPCPFGGAGPSEFGGKKVRPSSPSFPDRPMHPKFGRPEFPQDPRDPWPWISLGIAVLALIGAIAAFWRTCP